MWQGTCGTFQWYGSPKITGRFDNPIRISNRTFWLTTPHSSDPICPKLDPGLCILHVAITNISTLSTPLWPKQDLSICCIFWSGCRFCCLHVRNTIALLFLHAYAWPILGLAGSLCQVQGAGCICCRSRQLQHSFGCFHIRATLADNIRSASAFEEEIGCPHHLRDWLFVRLLGIP